MLSFVIPYHNDGEELIQTTISQIADTIDVSPYEIIVVDDGSDEPLSLEEAKVIRHPFSKGVGAAFDTGVAEAKYENIILMGDDIRFMKNGWASKMLRHIQNYPKSLIASKCIKINKHSRCHNEEIIDGKCTKCGKPALDNMDIEYRRNSPIMNGATILIYHDEISNPGRVPENFRSILEARWLPRRNDTEPFEIPCVLGAFYGVKKSWYKYIDGWAGHRRWGTLEPMISLKSWLFGGSCILAPDIETAHIFKFKKDARPIGSEILIYNKMLTALLLFPDPLPLVNFFPKQAPAVQKALAMILENEDWIISKMEEYREKIVIDHSFLAEKFGLDYRVNNVNPELIREEANKIYANKDRHYSRHYSKSPYLKIWEHAASYINGVDMVCDIGCGPGQLMELLLDKDVTGYTGIDISPVAISKACDLLSKRKDAFKVSLVCTNILNGFTMPQADKYVLIEILEHLNEDKQLLAKIPRGKEVILSVPSYLGGSHVRKFDNAEQVKERYGSIVLPEEIVELKHGSGKIFVLKGIKT